MIESGEVSNNDKAAWPTRTENRQPICVIARGTSPQSARNLFVPARPPRDHLVVAAATGAMSRCYVV